MSRFYGKVQGERGPATRCGHAHIKASVQSYDGSVITELHYEGNELKVRVCTSPHSSDYGSTEFLGTLDELRSALGNRRLPQSPRVRLATLIDDLEVHLVRQFSMCSMRVEYEFRDEVERLCGLHDVPFSEAWPASQDFVRRYLSSRYGGRYSSYSVTRTHDGFIVTYEGRSE